MEPNRLRALPYVALAAVITANVLGNILLKMGSSVDAKHAPILGVFGWQTVLGISCFAASVILYALALKVLPLYTVQAVVSLQYIGVFLSAAVIFGEIITRYQWLGIAFIIVGLSLVTRQIG